MDRIRMSTTASHLPLSLQSPKKKRIRWWITGIVILMLLGGGASYYSYAQTLPTPQKTLAAYCDGWITKNAGEMYLQENAAWKAQEGLSDLQQFLAGGGASLSTRACSVRVIKVDGSSAVAGVYLTDGSGHYVGL